LRAVISEGYEIPTPIQAQAIPHVLAGRDLLGCAQTGTGKTAAFALPVLHRLMTVDAPQRGKVRRIRTLVLSPTRELACQIGDSFKTYGRHTSLRHTLVYGGVSQFHQVRDLQRGVDTLIATPGRLCDLMNQGFIDLNAVEVFVLDEADRMLDMGFMPDLRRIVDKLPKQRQTLMFSATMPEPIEELAHKILRDPVQVRIAPVKSTTALIEQAVCFVSKADKPAVLYKLLSASAGTRAIVFTRTKHGADRLTKLLQRDGIRAEAIHGNKTQNARQKTLASFKSNRTHVLVATDLAARGIDVDGVSHVFNYELPHEPETYIHRIGRTGRAGAEGIAIALCDHEEHKHLRAIEKLLNTKVRVDQDLAGELAAPEPRRVERPSRPSFPPGQRQQQGRRARFGSKPSGGRPNSARPSGGSGAAHASGGSHNKGRRRRPASSR
jgi:ATP-dependent RNA helicase RhlE